MKNVTAIVISFLRPAYTIACIESLRRMYPEISIIVGENGQRDEKLAKVCQAVGAEYHQLPYDSGVCVGRNTLIRKVTTPYVLVGDDDFLYDEGAGVDDMVAFLEEAPEYDLIGGRVIQGGIVRNYQGHIEYLGSHFKSTPIDLDTQEFAVREVNGRPFRYCPADLTFNYFVARKDKVKDVPWDEEIKVAYEHFSWFYDFKVAGGRVAFSPDPIVIHKPEHIQAEIVQSAQHAEYQAFRNRKTDRERFFRKYGISYTIGMNGTRTDAPNSEREKRGNDTKYVDFCITTFKRPKALERLLLSIAKHYPMANVYVADQNEVFDRPFYKDLRARVMEAGLVKRPSFESLPYDCGLSYARNHLVRTTPNRYKLILDDDMEFSPDTDIGKMVKLLEAFPHAGVVGGKVRQLGHDVHFEFNLEIDGDTIRQIPDKGITRSFEGVSYRKTGCVLNFALFRKEVFEMIQWDQGQKVTEHMDFYLRWRSLPYNIFYTPDVVIEHPPAEKEGDYKEFRTRPEFLVRMFQKHGVRRVKYLNGQVSELQPDGSIKRYKENV